MKSIFTLLINLIFIGTIFCQEGFEGIIVERYYITDTDDAANEDGGKVKERATTYRIYVDMKPGWIFQTAYGVPGHELKLETSTTFFNNEDRGSKHPTYSKSQARANTVMLDSWLSVGGACAGQLGILKYEDNGIETVSNKDGILQNDDEDAGIPLTEQDGMVAGVVEPVTTIGIDNEILIFDNTNDIPAPHSFKTSNGAWAALNGAKGPDSLLNKVLIGQMTTDGVFSFELNIQMRRNSDLKVEKYVAKDPLSDEFTLPSLSFNSAMTASEDVSIKESKYFYSPNPSNGIFTFNGEIDYNKSTISLIHSSGKMIFANRKMKNQIDLNQFPNGIYFVQINDSVKTQILKIVKN